MSGSGGWGATSTTCMATYNKNRIFAIWRSTLYEVLESNYASFGSGYSTGSALVQLGSYMFTTTGSSQNGRLRRITINGSSATIEPWGSVGVYSLGLTTVVGGEYIIGTDNYWTLIGERGDGHTMKSGSCSAITTSPHGAIYAITGGGDIHWISAIDGSTHKVLTTGGRFKGARGIVWFEGYLYAIGTDGRFYRIDPQTGQATIRGSITNWDINGKMTVVH